MGRRCSVFRGSHAIAEAVRSASLPLRSLRGIVFVLTFLGSWQRAHQGPRERGPGGQALSQAPHPCPSSPGGSDCSCLHCLEKSRGLERPRGHGQVSGRLGFELLSDWLHKLVSLQLWAVPCPSTSQGGCEVVASVFLSLHSVMFLPEAEIEALWKVCIQGNKPVNPKGLDGQAPRFQMKILRL